MKSLTAAVLLIALGACNTVEGVGRDIAAGGQVIEDAASDVKRRTQPVASPAPVQQPIYNNQVYTPSPSTANSQYIY